MTLWFGPYVEVAPDHGYFYLCPDCYRERVRPHLEKVQGRLAELHPAAAAFLERERATARGKAAAEAEAEAEEAAEAAKASEEVAGSADAGPEESAEPEPDAAPDSGETPDSGEAGPSARSA